MQLLLVAASELSDDSSIIRSGTRTVSINKKARGLSECDVTFENVVLLIWSRFKIHIEGSLQIEL